MSHLGDKWKNVEGMFNNAINNKFANVYHLLLQNIDCPNVVVNIIFSYLYGEDLDKSSQKKQSQGVSLFNLADSMTFFGIRSEPRTQSSSSSMTTNKSIVYS